MKADRLLRQHLVELLTSDWAHVTFETAVNGIPKDVRGRRPEGAVHSPWEVLEHMRIAQWDILEFTRDPKHRSPEFSAGYWPTTEAPPSEDAWDRSVAAFRSDLRSMTELVADEATDLFSKIPHGDGQTVLREALVLADHNAYHMGQLIELRRLLGAWK